MASLKRYLEKKLRLKVNEAKSRVDRPWNCKFLGYSMTVQRACKQRSNRWNALR
jgi:hypothetical protein